MVDQSEPLAVGAFVYCPRLAKRNFFENGFFGGGIVPLIRLKAEAGAN